MDASLIFYIALFAIFFILPAIARRNQKLAVEEAFKKVQRRRKTRILAIVHRQEPMALLGVPQLRYIDLNDAEDVLNAIRATPPDMPLEVIVHTPGGLIMPALQIARALKAHPAKTTVYVPHYAMSGGTLIAMSADEIVLNSHAVLGPIDPQIGGLPAASIKSVVSQKDPNAIQDYTLVLADVAAKAQQQLERAALELMHGTVSQNAAISAAEQLSSGRWTHDYPIEAGEAAELGLPISNDMPRDITEIMRLFPDRLSGRSVKFVDLVTGWFRPRPKPAHPLPGPAAEVPASERLPFTGYEPGPGARSFSYGPWNPTDLLPQGRPGPRRRN